MKNLKNAPALTNEQKQALKEHELMKSQVDKHITDIITKIDETEDIQECLYLLNKLDDIVSAEIYHWSNILESIPEDCSPCMETKGKQAEYFITELTPLIDAINTHRKNLINLM